jgi:diketogulonate reductase-like aldo/keto reductase
VLPPILKNPKVVSIATKYGISPANVLISLQLSVSSWSSRSLLLIKQEGNSVLPKSVTPARIEENMRVVQLTQEDMNQIAESCQGMRSRYCDFGHITMYKFYDGLNDDD